MARYRSELKIESDGTEDFRVAIRELRRADRSLPDEFLRSIKEVARGLRDAAKVKALAQPSEGKGHTGLRQSVAKGVRIIPIPEGVRVITESRERDEAIIPRGMDMRKGWRHPVFGNMNRWVRQTSGTDSWFMDTMRSGQEPIRNRLINDINDAAERIARAS